MRSKIADRIMRRRSSRRFKIALIPAIGLAAGFHRGENKLIVIIPFFEIWIRL